MSAALIGFAVGIVLSIVIFWSMGAFDKPHPMYGKPFGLGWEECAIIVLVNCGTCTLLASIISMGSV